MKTQIGVCLEAAGSKNGQKLNPTAPGAFKMLPRWVSMLQVFSVCQCVVAMKLTSIGAGMGILQKDILSTRKSI